MIASGSENIYRAEIEAILAGHPDMVAVIKNVRCDSTTSSAIAIVRMQTALARQ